MEDSQQNSPLPRSLHKCFPLVWSQVLFPGRTDQTTSWKLLSILVLIVAPGILLYPCLDFHLFEPDEGRYAEIPREMLVRGEWVVPYLQGKPYLDKPPLLYWLVMASYSVLGVHDWSARLVPSLAVHLTIVLVYLIGRRSLGERPAFWGALLLGLAPGFISVGRILVLDGLLTLWVTLALLAGFEAIRGDRLHRAWWLVSSLACGLGVLTKGPIALLLVAAPLLAYLRLNGGGRIGVKPIIGYGLGILSIALPWYVLLCLRRPDFAWYFLWEHNVIRFVKPFDHLEPVWFYVPIVLGGLLPGTLFLVSLVRFLFSSRDEARTRRCPEWGFMLLSAGWCVLFFSLSGCKLPTYVLPAFPPLALALGYHLVQTGWSAGRTLPSSLAAAFIFLGGLHFVVLPWFAEFRSPMGNAEQVIHYCRKPEVPVICYPRPCDSVGFYLKRDNLINFRSKSTPEMIEFLKQHPRSIILFTHRHSMRSLRQVLPPPLRMRKVTPLFDSAKGNLEGILYLLGKAGWLEARPDSQAGMCYMAVIRKIAVGD